MLVGDILSEKPNIAEPVIDGDNHSFPKMGENVRYHLVMPTVPRETLPMQYLACCDYFHTSVIFRVPDIFVFV